MHLKVQFKSTKTTKLSRLSQAVMIQEPWTFMSSSITALKNNWVRNNNYVEVLMREYSLLKYLRTRWLVSVPSLHLIRESQQLNVSPFYIGGRVLLCTYTKVSTWDNGFKKTWKTSTNSSSWPKKIIYCYIIQQVIFKWHPRDFWPLWLSLVWRERNYRQMIWSKRYPSSTISSILCTPRLLRVFGFQSINGNKICS